MTKVSHRKLFPFYYWDRLTQKLCSDFFNLNGQEPQDTLFFLFSTLKLALPALNTFQCFSIEEATHNFSSDRGNLTLEWCLLNKMSHLFRVILKPDKRKQDQSKLSDFLSPPSRLSHHQQGSTQYLYIAPFKWISKDFPLCLQAIQKKKKKKRKRGLRLVERSMVGHQLRRPFSSGVKWLLVEPRDSNESQKNT